MNLEFVKGKPYFTKINSIEKQYNYLTEDIETDVIIVGGGVTGSILGYYFSKNNINSVILEKNIIGHESTSITTALLQYELDSTANVLKEYTTCRNIIKSYKLGLKALNEIKEFANEYGNNFHYKVRDALLYSDKILDIEEIKAEYLIRKENGFPVEYITEENNPFRFSLKAGVLSKSGGAEIDPYKFANELLNVSIKKGLKVYENTEVVDVKYNKEGVDVLTRYDHKVKGKIVIVATGYNTNLFTDRKFGTTTEAFNIVTKPIDNLEKIYNGTLIRDNNVPYNYIRKTMDNRLIIGGEDVDFLKNINSEKVAREKYNILEQRLKSIFTDIKDIEFAYKYCGAFTSTQDNLGFIGKDPKNEKLWFNLGYGANGILFAILGGIFLSKMYLGEVDEDIKLFNVGRYDY
ncbi:MAG: FAD-dependent oxidoreductase [Clostridium perfringens]|nr:FAD-dependent oxidoreductase [Clostridium perfringens]